MLKPRNIKVTVVSTGSYDQDWPKDNIQELRNWLDTQIAKAPEEVQNKLKFELDSEFDSGRIEFELYYERDETPEEVAAREREIIGRGEAERAQEIAMLRRLRMKYPEV